MQSCQLAVSGLSEGRNLSSVSPFTNLLLDPFRGGQNPFRNDLLSPFPIAFPHPLSLRATLVQCWLRADLLPALFDCFLRPVPLKQRLSQVQSPINEKLTALFLSLYPLGVRQACLCPPEGMQYAVERDWLMGTDFVGLRVL